MRRTEDTYKATDLFGTGKHGFTDGVLDTTPATIVHAGDLNHLQEEMARAIEGAGYTPSGNVYNQLLGALQMADLQRALAAPLWTTPSTPELKAIAGGISNTDTNNRAVAVGAAGTLYRLASTTQFVADTADAGYVGTFNGVCVGFGIHIAVGNSGEIQTGVDGTWTRRKTGGFSLYATATKDTLAVVAGVSGALFTSLDGITWTSRTSALAGHILHVVWAPALSLWIACATDGIQTSPDGITWTQRSALDFDSLVWSESMQLGIASQAGGNLHTSVDGLTWVDSGFDLGVAVGDTVPVVACAGGYFFHHEFGIFRGARWIDGTVSNGAIFVSPQNENSPYEHISYDPIFRVFWLCGPLGAVGFSPAPWGI